MLLLPRMRALLGRLPAAALAVGMVAVMLGPTSYALATVARAQNSPDPRSGQAVCVRKSVIEQFVQQRNMSFCWLCQLTGYHRERQSRGYTSFAEQRIYHLYQHEANRDTPPV